MTDPAGCVLAFDFGLKHIGVAVGQTITATATPLTTLRARAGKPDWNSVDELVNEWRPIRLLIGLPLNMDDSESEMSELARRFGAKLTARSGIEIAMVDERLTSYATRNEPESHASAAALIAETWLTRRGAG